VDQAQLFLPFFGTPTSWSSAPFDRESARFRRRTLQDSYLK
jgi:hypothetical protein